MPKCPNCLNCNVGVGEEGKGRERGGEGVSDEKTDEEREEGNHECRAEEREEQEDEEGEKREERTYHVFVRKLQANRSKKIDYHKQWNVVVVTWCLGGSGGREGHETCAV